MPLLPGNDREIIAHNVREMLQAGHPEDQAVAAALHNAGLSNKRVKPVKRPTLHPMHPFNGKSAPGN